MSFTPQSVFLKQQLNHVLDLAFQETFPALKARTFIPVNRSIPPAAEIDKLAVNGHEKFGIKGLLGHTGSIISHTLGKWFDDKDKALKPPEQMLSDINQLVSSIAEDTNNVLLPDTLLLPVKHFAYLAQTPYSPHSQVTILNYLLSNNPYIKNIDSWVHLQNQCVVYPRTPQALEMYLPLEFEMLEPQAVGMNIRIHCHARFGGVQVYTPKACAYGVGI